MILSNHTHLLFCGEICSESQKKEHFRPVLCLGKVKKSFFPVKRVVKNVLNQILVKDCFEYQCVLDYDILQSYPQPPNAERVK